MMIHINRLILFLSISFILPTSVFAMDMATQPTSGVFKFQHKLASNGNARAQYKLGSMYEYGTGVDLDIEKAKHWYGLSSTAGVKSANDRLTYLSVKERGYDPAKNSVWLDGVKKSANKSNGDAMFLLAQLYREGFGVDKDLGKALEILDRVSLLGAADVEDERALIQAEMIASKKAEKAEQRKNEIDAARLAKQNMVVANQNQANLVYLNDSTGSFSDSGQSLGENDSYAVALGDIDNDGDLDMVIANQNQASLVYINDGAGGFIDSEQSLGANDSRSVALGDVDRDGDLDMVVANQNQDNRVYLNNGSGNFSDDDQSLGVNSSQSIALGGLNSDGILSVVVANAGQGNRIYNYEKEEVDILKSFGN